MRYRPGSGSSMIPTARRISLFCITPTVKSAISWRRWLQKRHSDSPRARYVGNAMALSATGRHLCANIELNRRRRAADRSAGTAASWQPRKEICSPPLPSDPPVPLTCRATIGGWGTWSTSYPCGEGGRSRWTGRRPKVRGSAMNPVDHPHGGGEGKAPIGLKSPVTPWGKPTLGYKTRRKKKQSDHYIVHSRKG